MFIIRSFNILIFLLVISSFYGLKAKDSARFSVGIGIFNYMEDGSPPHNDQSGMLNVELHSGKKMFNLIKPFAGFLGTNESAYYAYGGFGIDGYYGKKKNFVMTPSLIISSSAHSDVIKAGNPLEFYIGIDVFYRFKNKARLGVGIFHISNADSGKKNPGSETLVLKYQIPFGR